MFTKVDDYFNWSWKEYLKICPTAAHIAKALEEKNEIIINDHIALRTLNDPKIEIKRLSSFFRNFGFMEMDSYEFPEKKLHAKYFLHPERKDLPKIFISELKVEDLSVEAQNILKNCTDEVPDNLVVDELFEQQSFWKKTHENYKKLMAESEYAAWFYAWGIRPNHFTISVNHLERYSNVTKINDFVKGLGHNLNDKGGEIKGSPQELLEQSSTMADKQNYRFAEGEFQIASVYMEFALRYPEDDGKLYQGFIEASANKIFESTDS